MIVMTEIKANTLDRYLIVTRYFVALLVFLVQHVVFN